MRFLSRLAFALPVVVLVAAAFLVALLLEWMDDLRRPAALLEKAR